MGWAQTRGCLLASMILVGCTDTHLGQGPGDMLVRTGSIYVTLRAAPFADLFLTYALLADQTRKGEVYSDGQLFLDDKAYCFPTGALTCTDLTPRARVILGRWRLVRTWNDPAQFPCKPERTMCTQPLRGLGVQVWVQDDAVCSEAVIAFRGTDPESVSDWATNFRWLLRLLPLYDQYDQVQDYAAEFVDAIEHDKCFVRGTTRIVAVGHSLGGGLAQQVAYVEPRIRHVYAFDPSVVTGSSDARVRQLIEQTGPGLRIDRIYEHGEFLAYLRFIQRQLAPASACTPQIRSIRFNTVHGSPTRQHKLSALIIALLRSSNGTQESGKRVDLPESADCQTPAAPGPAIVNASARAT